jgi:cytidylate kinase
VEGGGAKDGRGCTSASLRALKYFVAKDAEEKAHRKPPESCRQPEEGQSMENKIHQRDWCENACSDGNVNRNENSPLFDA